MGPIGRKLQWHLNQDRIVFMKRKSIWNAKNNSHFVSVSMCYHLRLTSHEWKRQLRQFRRSSATQRHQRKTATMSMWLRQTMSLLCNLLPIVHILFVWIRLSVWINRGSPSVLMAILISSKWGKLWKAHCTQQDMLPSSFGCLILMAVLVVSCY